jgi:hypothetical protein
VDVPGEPESLDVAETLDVAGILEAAESVALGELLLEEAELLGLVESLELVEPLVAGVEGEAAEDGTISIAAKSHRSFAGARSLSTTVVPDSGVVEFMNWVQ